jgi:hypothetical protein
MPEPGEFALGQLTTRIPRSIELPDPPRDLFVGALDHQVVTEKR